VHVNTLRYRHERIESLVGGPLDDPCRAVPLRVAMLARATIGSSVAGGAAEQ
jgi:DNA-binding PucR family transcriptional regulator